MPRVPTYQRQVTSITPVSNKVQASGDANAYGAGVANQFGQLASMATARAEEMQAEDDRNMVIGAKSAIDTQMSSLLYDENKGYLNQKGQNALDITSRFNQDYDNLVKTTAQTLNTKRQQDVFNQYAMGQKDNYLRSISSHQARERQTYTEDTANTAITSAQNLAIVDPNNQSVFDNSIATINKTIDSVYRYRGKEVVESMKFKALSDIRLEQAASMLSQGQGIPARDFLIAHKSEIDPKKYDNAYAGAESRAMVQESKAVADDVFSRYGLRDQRAGMEYFEKTYGNNPGREKFKSAVEARYTDENVLKNREETQYRKDLAKQIDSSGSMEDANNLIDGSDLPLQTKNELKSAIKTKFKRLADPGATKEQKFYASYEARGLYKDQELMDEYEKRVADGEEIPVKQQTRYNQAAIRINNYTRFSSGGAYNPSQGYSKDELKQHETDMWNAIEKLAESNVPQADIIQKIQQIAPKYGFDPNYFIDGTEWDKIGKVKGQYGG